MPKPITTYDAVAQTAEALLNESQDPLIALQERTGGSFSTIKRHLDVWTAKRQFAQAVQVPASIAD